MNYRIDVAVERLQAKHYSAAMTEEALVIQAISSQVVERIKIMQHPCGNQLLSLTL